MATEEFPSHEEVLRWYDEEAEVRRHVLHNLRFWRNVRGGLALTERSPLRFDPRREYWHMTERRVLVSYFSKRFRHLHVPAAALRRLAVRTFVHFDHARQAGRLGEPVLADEHDWQDWCARLMELAESIPDWEEYAELRRVWPHLRHPSLREDLLEFLQRAREKASPEEISDVYYKRLAWFPYLGLADVGSLFERQRFFFGFYMLFTSTNAYAQAGSMSFASVLQNNPLEELVSYAQRWANGERPDKTGFQVEARTDPSDRSANMTVVELFGFLNLHRQPFLNSRTVSRYRDAFEAGESSYDVMEEVGNWAWKFLQQNDEVRRDLARRWQELTAQPPLDEGKPLGMEGIRRKSVVQRSPGAVDELADGRLEAELTESARKVAQSFDEREAALALFHLILDAGLYQRSLVPSVVRKTGKVAPVVEPAAEDLTLPSSLRRFADDALGFLRAGFHVLFAGPPGTGKTTVAQFVGHAWNQELETVRDSISRAEAPATTVGNSAWAPFHTIGGILPADDRTLAAHKGIFIDPDFEDGGTWKLRGDCLVLDEMNRADLDRCIGELYPLLSGSVEKVHPAGIPGVREIRSHDRFRLVATVNDATIDDIVFPISEGLARRFVRIELAGATREDLGRYVSAEEAEGRQAVAESALDALFEALNEHLEGAESLPFGVGYFGILRAWVRGTLVLSPDFYNLDSADQARQLIYIGLRPALRGRPALADRLKGLESAGEAG